MDTASRNSHLGATMIRVRWERSSGHLIVAVDGHEPNAEPGSAVVCAAVSAITQGFVVVLEAVAEQNPGTMEVFEGCARCEHKAHDGYQCWEPRVFSADRCECL